ncbi:MAG: hypothetical protein OEZ04_00430 [Nitrospinota bacterium]|nr:hypothetical protein [Nitrospinota bacterium]
MKKMFIVVLLCFSSGMAGCGSGVHDVVYSVTGDTPSVKIWAKIDNGKIFKESGIQLPWEKKFTNNVKWPLQLTVTNEGDGSFTAQIIVDDQVVAEDSGIVAGDVVDISYDTIG